MLLLFANLVVSAADTDTCASDEASCQGTRTIEDEEEEEANTTKETVQTKTEDEDNNAVSTCRTISCITDWLAKDYDNAFGMKPRLVSNTEYYKNIKIDWSFDDVLDIAANGLTWSTNNMVMNQGVKKGKSQIFHLHPHTPGQLITREELEKVTKESTLLVGATHSINDAAASVIQAFQQSLKLPASINTYITRGGFDTAAPLHTDRFHTFIMQVSGKKHWRVYEPLVKNPVWGVHGDAEWAKDQGKPIDKDTQVGKLLVNHVMQPGDILYFPRGYPHETSTTTKEADESVALTVAVHTESLHLVHEKYFRCVLSQSGFFDQHPPVACPMCEATLNKYVRSEEGQELRQSLPLMGMTNKEEFVEEIVTVFLRHLPQVAKHAIEDNPEKAQTYFTEDRMEELIPNAYKIAEHVFESREAILKNLEEALSINNQDIPYDKKQAHWYEVFSSSKIFDDACHRGGMRALFSDYNEGDDLDVFIEKT